MTLTLTQRLQADRFDAIEHLLNEALVTLGSTKGRAEVDHRGLGATKFLVERSIQSLAIIRRQVLTPFPKVCRCGDSYDELMWKDLEYVGIQHGADGDRLELRNCGGCRSTLGIPISDYAENAE